MAGHPVRSTYKYRQAVLALKREGDTRCFTCSKPLYASLPWPHPNSITLGHIVALEDGGDPYDRSNHAAQCQACNSRDGQRRTQRNKQRKNNGWQTTTYIDNRF